MIRHTLLFLIYWIAEVLAVWLVLWATAENYDGTETRAVLIIGLVIGMFGAVKSFSSVKVEGSRAK